MVTETGSQNLRRGVTQIIEVERSGEREWKEKGL